MNARLEPPAATLSLRRAVPDDIPVIRALADRIWRASYAAMLSPAQIDYMLGWMYAADRIAAEMAGGVFWFVAVLDDATVGYLALTLPDDGAAELNKLYLEPRLQGLGHGQVLLAAAMKLAAQHGRGVLRLRVNKTNGRALRAYKRAGFVEVDSVVADIGGGFVMDDYVLACQVDAAG